MARSVVFRRKFGLILAPNSSSCFFRNLMFQGRCQSTKVGPFMALHEDQNEISFDESERIFYSKELQEIIRTLFVLKISSFGLIVRHSLPLMEFGKKVLGQQLFETVMKRTMYSQFVAGEGFDEVKKTAQQLQMHGIQSMLCVPTEEDISEGQVELKLREPLFERNYEVIHDCISKTEHNGKSQMRITAVCSPVLLLKLTNLLQPYETSPDIPEELSIRSFAKGLDADLPHSTPLTSLLTQEENTHLVNTLQRLDKLAKYAGERNVRLVIDAEQSYLEGGIHHLILALQSKYNKQGSWVYGTYQCYRKDTMSRVLRDLQVMSTEGFHFGAKIVRGAYRQMEEKRAQEMGYANPIHDSYGDTCDMYNDVMQVILEKVAQSPAQLMIATHNEDSISLATRRMAKLCLPKTGRVSFAQVYGMCDHASFVLGKKGFDVYKSVPCGPVGTTLPYLARRVVENSDIFARAAKERALYWQEISNRLRGVLQWHVQ